MGSFGSGGSVLVDARPFEGVKGLSLGRRSTAGFTSGGPLVGLDVPLLDVVVVVAVLVPKVLKVPLVPDVPEVPGVPDVLDVPGVPDVPAGVGGFCTSESVNCPAPLT